LDKEEHERSYRKSFEGEKMNRINLKKILYLIFILIFGFLGMRCAAPKEELKTYPKDYVHPLTKINLEKVFNENRGLEVLEENATTVYDYYRGGVQEKEEGERLMKESKWPEARAHLEKSNRFLRVVIKYLPEDEPSRNVYGDQMVIFLPNLLIADNDLKLLTVYKTMKDDDKVAEVTSDGKHYLELSLKSVKTEWAYEIKKGLEAELPKK
jgi:hypothetical protein